MHAGLSACVVQDTATNVVQRDTGAANHAADSVLACLVAWVQTALAFATGRRRLSAVLAECRRHHTCVNASSKIQDELLVIEGLKLWTFVNMQPQGVLITPKDIQTTLLI